MSFAESVVPILQEFLAKWTGILAISLTDSEGIIVAKILPQECDTETAGTVVASVWSMVENVVQEFGRKQLKQMFIHGQQGIIILQRIEEKFVLMVFATHNIPKTTLLTEVHQITKQIAQLTERA